MTGLHLTREQLVAFGIPVPEGLAGMPRKRAPRRGGGSIPQDLLWNRVRERWPESAVAEYKGAVPGRRFSIDIAFPKERLAVEVDGWEFHGKHLASFKQDRLKQNLLTVNGWRILRFFPEQIYSGDSGVMETIAEALRGGRTLR